MEAQSDLDFSQMLLHRGEQEEPCDGRLLTTNPSDLTQANAAKRKAGMSATILQDGSHQDGPASSTSAKRSKLSLGRDTTLRRLACPYSKRDRHQAQLPEICLGPGWNKVTRIREHLKRRHMLSKFPCPRCHGRFDSEADRSSHLRAVELCEVQDRSTPEVITADQLSRLSFKGSKASEADKWEQMYRIIFPEDPAVPSPYVDGPCGRCVSGAESRLLEESFRELGSSFCRELAALPGLDARGGDLAARLAGILQRAAVDILARFRAARGAPSPRGAPRPGARLDGGPAAAATPRGADTAYRAPAPLDAWFSQFSTSAEENRALVDHMPLAAGNDAHDAAGAQESWGYEGLFDFQLG